MKWISRIRARGPPLTSGNRDEDDGPKRETLALPAPPEERPVGPGVAGDRWGGGCGAAAHGEIYGELFAPKGGGGGFVPLNSPEWPYIIPSLCLPGKMPPRVCPRRIGRIESWVSSPSWMQLEVGFNFKQLQSGIIYNLGGGAGSNDPVI